MCKVDIDSECCKGCMICVHACPKAVFSGSKKKRNKYGTSVPDVNASKCIGCQLCEKMCPDGAINVRSEKK